MPTIKVWIVADVDGYLGTMEKPNFRALNFDPATFANDYNIVTGPIEVPFDIPVSWNPKQAEIDKLRDAVSRTQIDTAEKTAVLQKRIEELSK